MDTLRRHVLITTLMAVAILAGGWFLLVAPKQDEAEGLREQVAAQQQQQQQLQTRLGVLRAKAAALPAKQDELVEATRKIPAETALPELVRALSEAARSAGVELVAVTPGAPVPMTDTTAPAAPAPAAPEVDAAAPAAAPPAALTVVPLTIDVAGEYFSLEQFLAELEELPRALRVTELTLKPAAGSGTRAESQDGSSLTSSISGQVYVAAGGAGAAAAQPPAVAPPDVQAPADAQPPAAATAG